MEIKYAQDVPSVVGRISSESSQGGKWQGSYMNSSEHVPASISNELLTERERIITALGGPAKGWIRNQDYGNAPYKKPVDYSAINQSRVGKNTMYPVPPLTKIRPGFSDSAQARKPTHQYIGRIDDSPVYDMSGSEVASMYNDSDNMLNGVYPGLYLPSSLTTLSHELNHVNNMPTLDYSNRVQSYARTAPGFSINTYPATERISPYNRTAEALQALAARKRSVAAETGEIIKTPEQMASSLQQLHDRQDGRRLVGGEHRLGNYLRTSTRDYDNAETDVSNLINNAGGPVMGPSMERILKSPREGFTHPAIKNISDTHREAIPDLVRNDFADTPESKIAHILGAGAALRFRWRRPK